MSNLISFKKECSLSAAKQAKTEKTTAKRRQQGRFHLKHK